MAKEVGLEMSPLYQCKFQTNTAVVLRSIRVRPLIKNLTVSCKLATLKRRMVGSLITCNNNDINRELGDAHMAMTKWSRHG